MKLLENNSDSEGDISENNLSDLEDEEQINNDYCRCKFMVYNKGNIRKCLKKKIPDNDFCRYHLNIKSK